MRAPNYRLLAAKTLQRVYRLAFYATPVAELSYPRGSFLLASGSEGRSYPEPCSGLLLVNIDFDSEEQLLRYRLFRVCHPVAPPRSHTLLLTVLPAVRAPMKQSFKDRCDCFLGRIVQDDHLRPGLDEPIEYNVGMGTKLPVKWCLQSCEAPPSLTMHTIRIATAG